MDETRFSGAEPWTNSASPYQEGPWRRLDHSYVIYNGLDGCLPYTQTNSPLNHPTNSTLPTCGSNISASPEPISTISTAPGSPRKGLSNYL